MTATRLHQDTHIPFVAVRVRAYDLWACPISISEFEISMDQLCLCARPCSSPVLPYDPAAQGDPLQAEKPITSKRMRASQVSVSSVCERHTQGNKGCINVILIWIECSYNAGLSITVEFQKYIVFPVNS